MDSKVLKLTVQIPHDKGDKNGQKILISNDIYTTLISFIKLNRKYKKHNY